MLKNRDIGDSAERAKTFDFQYLDCNYNKVGDE